MSINPIDRDAERRRNALLTRDNILKPTFRQHERRKSEDAERMAKYYIERAKSLRWQQGLDPLTEAEKAAIRAEHGAE